jgi:hypothetical protein
VKITYQRYLMDQRLRDSIEAEARRARAEQLRRLFAKLFGSLRRPTVKWEPFHRGSHVPGRAAQG